DDFRNFIKGDKVKLKFNLENQIESFLHLMEGTIKNSNIDIILNLENNIVIDGYENELTQCFINIFNNAKEELIKKIPMYLLTQRIKRTITMKIELFLYLVQN
ncbi:MAG: hypothetical protein U9R39_04810, partial [Campylobacterota bacterium]|nr:hypothetical protein [Campylobacterota bacterium]